MKQFSFSDLIDVDSLKRMQDSFSKYTGLAICVSSPRGDALVSPSGGSEFCWRLTQGSELGAKRCAECDRQGAHLAYSQCKAAHYTCHAGMTDFIIPIVYENKIIGTILAGQVRSDDFDPEKARKTAEELGIDPDEYIKAAENTRYMSKEDAEKTSVFLSEFAEALSVMAHTNYKRSKELEKTERAARSQSSFITGLTDDLRVNMKEWIERFAVMTEKYQDIPGEVRHEMEDLLFRACEVYSQIGGAVDYIRMSRGNVEYSEGVYSIRALIDKEADSFRERAGEAGITVETLYDDLLPETLAGNSGRIGQIVNKLTGSLVGFTKKGGKVVIYAMCSRTDYSCDLMIRIRGIGTRMTEKAAAAISSAINGGGAHVLGEMGKLTPNDTDFPLVVLLLKQMSGTLEAESLIDGDVSFKMTIPQLDGSKTNA